MVKKKCPNCGKKIDDYLIYCEFCGQILQTNKTKVNKVSSQVKSNVTIKKTSPTKEADGKIIVEVPKQKEKKLKWYTKPKRKRPWYHPLELFFWIGWGLYVFFRLIGTEILRYFKWCCYWGRPDDLD
ncbi:MAG: hypothetical protein FK731_06630 [Asgard group archaeon]|nr:hypothetical protein [Asgard group archaeon]